MTVRDRWRHRLTTELGLQAALQGRVRRCPIRSGIRYECPDGISPRPRARPIAPCRRCTPGEPRPSCRAGAGCSTPPSRQSTCTDGGSPGRMLTWRTEQRRIRPDRGIGRRSSFPSIGFSAIGVPPSRAVGPPCPQATDRGVLSTMARSYHRPRTAWRLMPASSGALDSRSVVACAVLLPRQEVPCSVDASARRRRPPRPLARPSVMPCSPSWPSARSTSARSWVWRGSGPDTSRASATITAATPSATPLRSRQSSRRGSARNAATATARATCAACSSSRPRSSKRCASLEHRFPSPRRFLCPSSDGAAPRRCSSCCSCWSWSVAARPDTSSGGGVSSPWRWSRVRHRRLRSRPRSRRRRHRRAEHHAGADGRAAERVRPGHSDARADARGG